MNIPSCERCNQKISVMKCFTCNKFLCEDDINTCQVNFHNLKKIILNYSPVSKALNKLKESIMLSINDLEASLNKLVVELIHKKTKTLEEISEYLNQIEVLESKIIEKELKDYDCKSVLFELLYLKHEAADLYISKLFTNNFYPLDIFRDSLSSQIYTFELQKLSEQVKSLSSSGNLNVSIKKQLDDSISKAANINSKLKDFKDFMALNRNLRELQMKLPINKLESYPFRRKLKKFLFQASDCLNTQSINAQTSLIPYFSNLKKLQIRFLNPQHSEPLFISLQQIMTLKVFSMTRCLDLTLTEFKNLSRFLKSIKLRKFKMNHCQSLSLGINILVSNLCPDRLEQLSIPGNIFGFDGCQGLVDPLKRFKHLKHLNIRSNDINASGAKILAQGLLALEGLEILDVACNPLRIQGIREVMNGLKNSKLLKYINSCVTGLPEEDEEEVNKMYLDIFQGFPVLQTVVVDMTVSKITVTNLKSALPDFCSIFISNSDEILPLTKNLR